MDKTFENITLFAQTKKIKVQENLEVKIYWFTNHIEKTVPD
jgi:hypothetical protein